MIPAAKIVGKKGKVYALDKDEKVLKDLMEKTKSFGLRNIEMIKTSGQLKVNLDNKSCDVVLLFDVFHDYYFPKATDRLMLLHELYRILKPNGFLSVYPKHFESKARKEIENIDFYTESKCTGRFIHDNQDFEKGQVLNFRKKP